MTTGSRTLVLIPGLNNTASVFDGVVDAIRDSTQVQPVDCPELSDLNEIAQVLLQQLPERFWLGGFSFGGYVALAMLELAPERIEGIALICSSPTADTPVQTSARQAAIARASQGDYLEMIEAQAVHAFHSDSLANEALMLRRRAMVQKYGVSRFVAHQKASIGRPDRSALLDGTRPTLLVAATDDKVFPFAALAALADSIPGAEFALVKQAGHLLPMEHPVQLAQALTRWMATQH